jgi:hypothetical protein
MTLRPCTGCARHVGIDERACPFCGFPQLEHARPPRISHAGRLSRAAVFAGLSACWTASSPEAVKTGENAHEQAPATAPAIGGVVRIADGGVLRGVVVQLYSGDKGLIASTTTDGRGEYAFAQLLPGKYQVGARYETAAQVGTAASELQPLADQPLRIDLSLVLVERMPQAMPYGAPPRRTRVV